MQILLESRPHSIEKAVSFDAKASVRFRLKRAWFLREAVHSTLGSLLGRAICRFPRRAMPRRRMSMRTIREVLRPNGSAVCPNDDIAASCRPAKRTVRGGISPYQGRGRNGRHMTDTRRRRAQPMIFPIRLRFLRGPPATRIVEVHRQLNRKGVTLQTPRGGVSPHSSRRDAYSQFEQDLPRVARVQDPTMIQEHKAGEKLFVGLRGQHPDPHRSPGPGESEHGHRSSSRGRRLQYTLPRATLTRPARLDRLHIRCFAFLGGSPVW